MATAKQKSLAAECENHAKVEISLLEKSFREKVEKLYDLVIRHDNTVYIGMTEMLWNLFFLWGALCGRRRAAEELQRIVEKSKRRKRRA